MDQTAIEELVKKEVIQKSGGSYWNLTYVTHQSLKGRVEIKVALIYNIPIPAVGDTIYHEQIKGPLRVNRVVHNIKENGSYNSTVYVGEDPFLCDAEEHFRDGWIHGVDWARANPGKCYGSEDFDPCWDASQTRKKIDGDNE